MNHAKMPRTSFAKSDFRKLVQGRPTPGEPLKTHTEMAEEFGITCAKLSSEMQSSSVKPPAPISRSRAGLWYKPSDLRTWRKAHKASLDVKA